jgi:meiotically up-regulated gene 157 (Mug157) protein
VAFLAFDGVILAHLCGRSILFFAMKRRAFVRGAGRPAANSFPGVPSLPVAPAFPEVRPAAGQRQFRSAAVEAAIGEFQGRVKDAELGWLFGNCLANTLDNNVTHTTRAGRPDTFVRAGDLDAMSLRDSAMQAWPYLALVTRDAALRQLVAGVINRQTQCILQDPYANSFYADKTRVGEWQPGVHERKWGLDSLCHPIRLGYHYWKITGDEQPFDRQWREAIRLTVNTFREQQRKTGPGPYRFQRPTANALDTQALAGAGYPARPGGLIASAFRPSGDATLLPFSVPANFFAVASLRQAALMLYDIAHEQAGYNELMALADEIGWALRQHALIAHPALGLVYAYEVDGYGGRVIMDDASVPGLLSLPYLGALPLNEGSYQSTRQLALSSANPFFFSGPAGAGIGSPRTGPDQIGPGSMAMRGLTSPDEAEIRACVQSLKAAHAGAGYLPAAFHKDDAGQATGPKSAGANALTGEFLWKVYQERPHLLA